MSLSPATRRRQRQVARWARRAPGYRWLVAEALPRVRRNRVLTDLALRVFDPDLSPGRKETPLHGGRHLTGRGVAYLPIVAVVGTDLTDDEAETLVEEVAEVQRSERSFRPVLVLDQPAFASARRHGYVLEVLPRIQDCASPGAWTDHVAWRLGCVIEHYRPWHCIIAQGPRLDALSIRLLSSLADRLPDDLSVDLVHEHEETSPA